MTNLLTTFTTWKEQGSSVIKLLNRNREFVGAVYLDQIDLRNLTILETISTEKYYLVINGIAVFFTYYQKVEK